MQAGRTTLRARRKRATHEGLAAAALRRFAAVGFDAATASEIAAEAGVSRRTFFRYYPTKEAVFFASQQARLGDFEQALAAPVASPAAAIARVERAALALAARYQQEREVVVLEHQILLGSATLHGHDAQLDERWEQALRQALRRGGVGDEDVTIVAGALLGVMRAVLRDWFAAGASFDLPSRGAAALARLQPLLAAVVARAEESP